MASGDMIIQTGRVSSGKSGSVSMIAGASSDGTGGKYSD